MELNTWLYFNACAWGNESTDLYNVPLWYTCMCMHVFTWRVCLGRVHKVSSYDLKCLQELLPLLKTIVSKSLVTFFIINAKVVKLPSLRTKQFSQSWFHTPALWSVLSWKETLCITLGTGLKVSPAGICTRSKLFTNDLADAEVPLGITGALQNTKSTTLCSHVYTPLLHLSS